MATKMKWENDGRVCHVEVSVSNTGVSWSFCSDGLFKSNVIKLRQLLKPRIEQRGDKSKLIVQYARGVAPKTEVLVRCAEIVFLGTRSDCEFVKTQIDANLTKNEPHRPKRVLIFINPKSGFQRGLQNYDRVVAPLMARCGVAVDDIVMKSAAQAVEVLDTYDLTSIDAVLAMGGDGTYMHVLNALMRRTFMDLNADLNGEPVTPSLPFGTIPSGSGCVSATLMCGATMDIETSVLSIVLGRTKPFDMVGAWQGSKSLGYGMLVAGCGLMSNIQMSLECIKWMGVLRYFFIHPITWWTWRNFDFEIDYLPANAEEPKTSSEVNGHAFRALSDTSDGWKTIRCRATETAMPLGPIFCRPMQHTKDSIVMGEVWIMAQGFRDLLESLLDKSYVRGRVDAGTLALSIITATNVRETYRGFLSLARNDKTKKQCLEQVDVKEVRIRGLEEWGDNSVGLAIFLDGERIELTGGASYEVKVYNNLLTALCLDDDVVQDVLADLPNATSKKT